MGANPVESIGSETSNITPATKNALRLRLARLIVSEGSAVPVSSLYEPLCHTVSLSTAKVALRSHSAHSFHQEQLLLMKATD